MKVALTQVDNRPVQPKNDTARRFIDEMNALLHREFIRVTDPDNGREELHFAAGYIHGLLATLDNLRDQLDMDRKLNAGDTYRWDEMTKFAERLVSLAEDMYADILFSDNKGN